MQRTEKGHLILRTNVQTTHRQQNPQLAYRTNSRTGLNSHQQNLEHELKSRAAALKYLKEKSQILMKHREENKQRKIVSAHHFWVFQGTH